MRFSNDGSTYTGWEGYNTSKDWVVPSGEGSKTVHAQFRDANSNLSAVVTDAITVDTVAPVSTASSPASTNRLSFSVSWSATDGASGVTTYDVQYRVGTGGTWTDWLTGTTATTATFGATTPIPVVRDQTYYFRVRAHDAAGNVETYVGGDGHTHTYVEEVYPIFLPLVSK